MVYSNKPTLKRRCKWISRQWPESLLANGRPTSLTRNIMKQRWDPAKPLESLSLNEYSYRPGEVMKREKWNREEIETLQFRVRSVEVWLDSLFHPEVRLLKFTRLPLLRLRYKMVMYIAGSKIRRTFFSTCRRCSKNYLTLRPGFFIHDVIIGTTKARCAARKQPREDKASWHCENGTCYFTIQERATYFLHENDCGLKRALLVPFQSSYIHFSPLFACKSTSHFSAIPNSLRRKFSHEWGSTKVRPFSQWETGEIGEREPLQCERDSRGIEVV